MTLVFESILIPIPNSHQPALPSFARLYIETQLSSPNCRRVCAHKTQEQIFQVSFQNTRSRSLSSLCMPDHSVMLAISATATASAGSGHIAESSDTAGGAPQWKDSGRSPSWIGSASSLPSSSFHTASDEQGREGEGDARTAFSAAPTTMCAVKYYFWLSTGRRSGAGRGDRRRGCVLTSCAGGAANS